MAVMIVWIVLLVQHSGIIETFRPLPHNFTSNLNLMSVQDIKDKLSLTLPKDFFKRTEGLPRDEEADRPEKEFSALRTYRRSSWKGRFVFVSTPIADCRSHHELDTRLRGYRDAFSQRFLHPLDLPTLHWTTLFGFYNMSLWGRYITVLPEIHVAIPIAHTEAVKFRHPEESSFQVSGHLLGQSQYTVGSIEPVNLFSFLETCFFIHSFF